MPVRRSSIVLATVGVVLIVLGVLVRFVVVPVATKLPGSTNLSVTYSGTATLLNSSALQSGDTKNVIATNVPTTVDRQLKVTGIQGDTAIVSDDLTIHAGSQALPSDHTYALDRTTLEGVTPPPGIVVEPSRGALSSTFPIGPQANDSYRYYDSTADRIFQFKYQGASGTTAGDIDGFVALASAYNLIGTGGAGGLTNGAHNNQVGVASLDQCVQMAPHAGGRQAQLVTDLTSGDRSGLQQQAHDGAAGVTIRHHSRSCRSACGSASSCT